mmetsp:Transcript_45121/g.115416  ORF Transcript_45121/g.115416 Transcript_45121/m.115416 type:complete len:241 (+) Transcript_45121:1496-2218(+)
MSAGEAQIVRGELHGRQALAQHVGMMRVMWGQLPVGHQLVGAAHDVLITRRLIRLHLDNVVVLLAKRLDGNMGLQSVIVIRVVLAPQAVEVSRNQDRCGVCYDCGLGHHLGQQACLVGLDVRPLWIPVNVSRCCHKLGPAATALEHRHSSAFAERPGLVKELRVRFIVRDEIGKALGNGGPAGELCRVVQEYAALHGVLRVRSGVTPSCSSPVVNAGVPMTLKDGLPLLGVHVPLHLLQA